MEPVYNLAPEPGEVAKIGFTVDGEFHYEGDIAVRAPGEGGAACDVVVEPTACEPYGLETTFYNASGGSINYDGFSLTIWGVPASPIHDPLRCVIGSGSCVFGASESAVQAPYFTNPTACSTEPLRAELHVTSWQEREPGAAPNPPPTPMAFGPLVGCDRLLDGTLADRGNDLRCGLSATGFDLDTEVPQTYDNPAGLATSTLKQEVVTLPEGMTVNPSSGCGPGRVQRGAVCRRTRTRKTQEEKEQGHGCPSNSKLATVRIKTPSISEEVTGSAYLAEPAPLGEAGKNPFNALLSLYIVARARDPWCARQGAGSGAGQRNDRPLDDVVRGDAGLRRPPRQRKASRRCRRATSPSNSTRAQTRRW